MRSTRSLRSVLLLLVFLTAPLSSERCSAADSRYEAAFQQQLLPMLRTYCFDCHDSGSEISLDKDDSAAAVLTNRKLWVSALNHVRAGSMPPEDGEMMDAATRKRMEQLIDGLANAVKHGVNNNCWIHRLVS